MMHFGAIYYVLPFSRILSLVGTHWNGIVILVIVGDRDTKCVGNHFGTLVIVTCSSSSRINTINQPTPGVVVICPFFGISRTPGFFTLSNVGIPESVTEVFLSKKSWLTWKVPKHP